MLRCVVSHERFRYERIRKCPGFERDHHSHLKMASEEGDIPALGPIEQERPRTNVYYLADGRPANGRARHFDPVSDVSWGEHLPVEKTALEIIKIGGLDLNRHRERHPNDYGLDQLTTPPSGRSYYFETRDLASATSTATIEILKAVSQCTQIEADFEELEQSMKVLNDSSETTSIPPSLEAFNIRNLIIRRDFYNLHVTFGKLAHYLLQCKPMEDKRANNLDSDIVHLANENLKMLKAIVTYHDERLDVKYERLNKIKRYLDYREKFHSYDVAHPGFPRIPGYTRYH